ncbi:YolD-like family protein [Brevibacillus sp. FSL L8-0520]|uniref:YolD-like family protein n=1 Tax=Brevibacillus sp. FSL L8-0520 TaxID=2954689 RepID=UPI0030CC415B
MARKVDNLFGASRFVLPEHKELYLQIKEDEKLCPMPILEQDELESIQYIIMDSARCDYAITVTWWESVKDELGKGCSMWGIVKWIDTSARRIKLVNDSNVQWIPMDRIFGVQA